MTNAKKKNKPPKTKRKLHRPRGGAHPVHDIEIPKDYESWFPVVVEIPMGSKMKYEIDKATGFLFLDRVLYSAVHYPANYGFIPRTHGEDGDPLDVLVVMSEPVVPGAIVHVRAIGGFAMTDDKGIDDKIVCVAVDDPSIAHVEELAELPPYYLPQLRRFFEDYKALENKVSEVEATFDRAQAIATIRAGLARYRRLYAK